MNRYRDSRSVLIEKTQKSIPLYEGDTRIFTPDEFAERFQSVANMLQKNCDGETFSTDMAVMDDGKLYKHNGIGYAFSPVDDGSLFVTSLVDR